MQGGCALTAGFLVQQALADKTTAAVHLSCSVFTDACRVFGPWLDGAVQQVEAGLNLTVVLTSDGQCFQMGETGASGRVKWDGCKEPELVSPSVHV